MSRRAPLRPTRAPLPAEPRDSAPRPWKPWRAVRLSALTGPRPHGVTKAFTNDWFGVLVRPFELGLHLLIRNRPNTPVRSWTDLQRIKNELFGEDATAIEVFPPQAEVIDQANMTHLWVLTVPDAIAPCSLVRWCAEADAATRAGTATPEIVE